MIKYRKKHLICTVATFFMFFSSFAAPPLSQKNIKEFPTLLYADHIAYDDSLKKIDAVGTVEIHNNGLSLYSDRVTYFQLSQKVIASGHVRLRDKEGNVLFFEDAELSADFKEAFINRIRMILSDEAKLTAAHGHRHKGTQSTFDQVVYSPCTICRKDSDYYPVWQLEAERVYWDEEKETIEYKDVIMRLKGIPILYSPYLNHPAPNIKRKSGLLTPSFGGGAGIGAMMAIPYYLAIDNDRDIIFTPGFYGSRPMLGLEYRQWFKTGRLQIQNSTVYDNHVPKKQSPKDNLPHTFRGHIKIDALYNLNDHIRAGFVGERVTDQTYLRKFNILGSSSPSMLTSRAFMEGFYGANYISLEGYDFQGMREQDIQSQTPMILPMLETKIRSKPRWHNSFWTLDSHASAIHRRIGSDVTKASATGGWVVPNTTSWGGQIITEAKVRADVYSFTDASLMTQTSHLKNGTPGRIHPWASSVIEWPWIRHQDTTRFVIEPIAGLVASPMSRTEDRFPNEDSRVIELNDLNMFSHSRFAGLDRIDAGSRVNYGLNLGAYTQNYGNGSLFFGQSYGFQKPAHFLQRTGMDKEASDYVGRLKLSYKDWLDLSARALLDRSTFTSQRQEFTTSFGQPIARGQLSYTRLPKIDFDPRDKALEQVSALVSSQITPVWSIDANSTRDLGGQGGALAHGVGATYADECFSVRISADKTYYADRDISPGVTFYVRLVFKNLGEVQQGRRLN